MSKIFHILRSINRNRLGFTLMELTIAMAVSGIICGSVTLSIFQVFDSSGRTSTHMTAIRQVRSAGYWVSHDALMAQDLVLTDESVDVPDGSRFPFTLTWSDWTSNEIHEVTYSIVGDELQRSNKVTDADGGTVTNTSMMAEFIDSTLGDDGKPKTRCDFADRKFTLTVTATVGAGSAAQTEARTYEVNPRPG